MSQAEQTASFFVGVDLGQAQDSTAVVVLQRQGSGKDALHQVVQMKRYPLGTAYPEIVKDLAKKLAMAPADTNLILDATGVGRAVVDLVRAHPGLIARSDHIHAVTITGGDTENREGNYWRVPKRNLVAAIQVLLQSQRLKVAAGLPETQLLVNELQNFKVKITENAHDTYGTWRDGQHDDLVLAASLACWFANRVDHAILYQMMGASALYSVGVPNPYHRRDTQPGGNLAAIFQQRHNPVELKRLLPNARLKVDVEKS
ncbi:MAG TPA: hypothetical protein VFD58_10830 [Blastocatellia bacterium]|nr:hypothetical protein [Blastocatellia bacterium]